MGVTASAASGATFGVRFSLPFFQDGQGFMADRAQGINSMADMAGKKLCFIDNTDNAAIVLAELAARHIRPIPFAFQEEGEMDAAIMDRHCQATSALISKLAEARSEFHDARKFAILPELLTLTPATAAVDARDTRLQSIVDWTISALLQAEFLGIDHASAATLGHSDDPRVQRLLGEDFATGFGLHLDHGWSRTLIVQVGNYGEIYDRSVGPGTPLDLPRGLNALWNKGGIMAPLPLQ
jgi:general L-amino acid transport system substrate-binding protein